MRKLIESIHCELKKYGYVWFNRAMLAILGLSLIVAMIGACVPSLTTVLGVVSVVMFAVPVFYFLTSIIIMIAVG